METVTEIEMRKISEVKPYIRNPRKNDKTVELLCEIIPKVGFNVPIVVDENGVIVKGHSRFKAAIKLGMEEVPCVVTHADDEAIKLDRLADNRVSEFSEWVDEALDFEIDSLNIDFDLSELGFETEFDDFDDFDEPPQTREDLERRFLEMQQNAPKVEIVTASQIEKAERKASEPKKKVNYYKVICEKCGHSMYVREGDVITVEE